jgi:hypothetical protein
LKATSVVTAAVFVGSEFQSWIVRGKKEYGHTLESVQSAKYLGCLISSELRWTKHINSIFGKANKTLVFQRRNLNIGSTTVKQNAYHVSGGSFWWYKSFLFANSDIFVVCFI